MSRGTAKPDGRTHTPGESPAQSDHFAGYVLAAAETTTRMITMRQEPRALSFIEDLTVLRRPRLAVRRSGSVATAQSLLQARAPGQLRFFPARSTSSMRLANADRILTKGNLLGAQGMLSVRCGPQPVNPAASP